jgi:hypothetical protein
MASFTSAFNVPNAALKPFRSEEIEFGVDLRFLNNRIGVDLTYYDQVTTDDIVNANISQGSGFISASVNLGKLTNKGIEALLTVTPLRGAITWNASFNLAYNQSKVISLQPDVDRMLVEYPRTFSAAIEHMVGHPYGMITGYKQITDPEGRPIFDNNFAPVTDGRFEILGNGVPKYTGGLNNSLTYKQFNLAVLIDFKWDGQIYSGTNVYMTNFGFHKQTLAGRINEVPLTVEGSRQVRTDNNGTPMDSSDDIPIYEPFTKVLTPGEAWNYWGAYSYRKSDEFVYDASFVKLRQVTLGYSFSRETLKKLPFRSLTISFVARNLAILYKATENIDPESSYTSSNAQGLDHFGMPSTRGYGFNLNATF